MKKPAYIALVLSLLAVTMGAYYLILPLLQSVFLPPAPAGGFLIRPAKVLLFGACAVCSALTLPLLQNLMHRHPKLRLQTPSPMKEGAKKALYLKGGLIFIVYLLTGSFYFLSYQTISEQGLSTQLPWGQRNYRFEQIEEILVIPEGHRDRRNKQREGPIYSLRFSDGSNFSFGSQNEALTAEKALEIGRFVAEMAGQQPRINPRSEAIPGS